MMTSSAVITEEEKRETRKKTAKPMLWIGIVSMIMLFAGLTSAYVVRQAEGNWLYFDIPSPFYWSTAIILLSSVTMVLAQRAIKNGDRKRSHQMLLATLALGLGFGVSQWIGWSALVDMGVYFTGHESNASGSFLYVLTGVHLAHMLGGIFALIFTTVKSKLKMYSAEDFLGIELTGIYWHFLDILWIYLLLFLVFIR